MLTILHTTFSNAFFVEKLYILFQILLKFIPKGPIHDKSALVQVMVWH